MRERQSSIELGPFRTSLKVHQNCIKTYLFELVRDTATRRFPKLIGGLRIGTKECTGWNAGGGSSIHLSYVPIPTFLL